MSAVRKVYVPAIYPAEVERDLMGAIKALSLRLTSLHTADVAILPSTKQLAVCHPLSSVFLLQLARYSRRQHPAKPGRAVTTEWLIASARARRLIPLEPHEIRLEVVRAREVIQAEGQWVFDVPRVSLLDAVNSPVIPSRGHVETKQRHLTLVASSPKKLSTTASSQSIIGFDDKPDEPDDSDTTFDADSPSTASSPLSSAPSGTSSESTVGPPRPPAPAGPSTANKTRRPHRAGAAYPAYPGETKGYRNRTQVRQVDTEPLDTLIRLLRARLADMNRPVRSVVKMFKELDKLVSALLAASARMGVGRAPRLRIGLSAGTASEGIAVEDDVSGVPSASEGGCAGDGRAAHNSGYGAWA